MDRYAVIGHPVAHSLSPVIHKAFAAATGEALEYRLLQAPVDGFQAAVDGFVAAGGRGLNVTLPFKEAAARWATGLDADARLAGAVNTLVPRSDGGWQGFNTDGAGLVHDLSHNLGWRLTGARVGLLGAGGAARGVIGPLLAAGVAEMYVANRTPGRAQALCDQFPLSTANLAACSLADLPEDLDLLINATSASLAGQGDLVADAALAGSYCYDMAYAEAATPFCSLAAARGAAAVADGLGMLVEQAARAFELWRGVLPDGGMLLANRRELFAARDRAIHDGATPAGAG